MKTSAAAQRTPVAPIAPSIQTIETPPLSLRADFASKTFNDEARTVELIFSTGAPVERFDWFTGKRYIEKLSLDPAHVRIGRLNEGGPLLDSHSAWSVSDQLGAVVPGSVSLTKNEARATVRFSRRASVDPVWQDVKDGIIRSVSVGYRTYKVEETDDKDNKLPIRTAVDWEPFEVSMVPIPADAGAKARDGKTVDVNACQLVNTRAVATKETAMAIEMVSEGVAELNPLAGVERKAVVPPAEPTDADRAMEAERKRVQGIINACTVSRMTTAFQNRLIAEGTELVDAQNAVFDEMKKRGAADRGPGDGPSGVGAKFVGEDPLVHVRAGIENALLHRVRPKSSGDPKGFELTDQGRPFRGMGMLRVAEALLNSAGIRTSAMSKMQIAGLALGLEGRAGMHSTSDFSNLLADVANKTLRRAYDEAPQTWRPIARQITLPDFKAVKRLQLGEAPALQLVNEHGEFTFGTITEGKEEFQLATYGRRFAITRKALVNDDTDAFSRVPTMFGRAARALESDAVWYQILKNANMGDGNALFVDATHGNYTASGTVISVDNLAIAFGKMQKQTGADGVTYLNISPRYLAVPPEKIGLALQYTAQINPALASSVNPFAGMLVPISEPRLTGGVTFAGDTVAGSATAWYLASSPDQIDIIEYAYLEGEEGPMTESRIGWEIDGLEIKCREDFAAKVIDWRGLYKNVGA
jgi:hypothetical protein